MKIVDKINAKVAKGETFFSFEFFPPKTDDGVENLWERMDSMVAHQPMFCDITWGAGGSTADLTLDIATKMQNMICVETMMHLTCTNMPRESLKAALDKVKSEGIQNILALRGDPPKGSTTFEAVEGGFSCALDLVRYIRAEYGDYFGLTVAGYPEAHPDVIKTDPEEQKKAYAADLAYLKQKVDAGGEVIVTQLFYDVELFLKFVDDCRDIGITVPIIPGIMPIQTYAGFARMVGFCKTYVPPEITAVLDGIKDNEEACRAYGIQLGVDMCRRMLAAGTPGIHLYSLNQDKAAVGILTGLGLINPAVLPRALPWRRPVSAKGARFREGVRPLHWAARPRSYLQRTAGWAAPPAARWAPEADGSGSREIAALEDYNALARPRSAKGVAARREALASRPLARPGDVAACFHAYLAGASAAFPWSESGAPPPETAAAAARLAALVDAGLLVLYGCGALHGAPSGAAATPGGWGAPGGRLFQKAYVEAFAPAAALPALQAAVAALPGGGVFLAARRDAAAPGGLALSGSLRAPAAAAWLLAPGAEVVQPTVLAPDAFAAWAPEAFAAWRADWAALYDDAEAPDAAASRATLAAVADSHVLFAAMAEDTEKGDALFAALTAAAKAKA